MIILTRVESHLRFRVAGLTGSIFLKPSGRIAASADHQKFLDGYKTRECSTPGYITTCPGDMRAKDVYDIIDSLYA